MDEYTKIFKALSNPHRLNLFLKILQGHQASLQDKGCFLGQLIENFKIGAPTISHHLKELVNADLVITEKEGKFIRCRVNESQVLKIKDLFK